MSLPNTSFISQLINSDMLNNEILSHFHFIRPWWLLAFFALFLALYLLKKARVFQSPWQHFLPQHLTKVLLANESKSAQPKVSQQSSVNKSACFWCKPFIIGSLVIIALAGPAWQKLPQPVYQVERGSVLIMDMSYSMYATDIKPNRLTRARYKANDLLTAINEGEIGLIAYAGDAFTISPLTQDIKNIELLLPSLSPDIMPTLGANALAALTLAHQTLKNSGHVQGDIYWFTDDIDNEELADIYAWSNEYGHRLNILGVGTTDGAPIKLSTGELLKDNSGAIVIPKLPSSKLAGLAQRGNGYYSTITSNDADIKTLTQHLHSDLNNQKESNSTSNENNTANEEQNMQGDQYQEEGPWLLLIALPLLLTYFRRGAGVLSLGFIAPLSLLILLSGAPSPSYANQAESSNTENSSVNSTVNSTVNNTDTSNALTQSQSQQKNSIWQNLWKTKDQQAQQQFNQQQYNNAAEQFEHPQWQGSAHYKAGNYPQALKAFEQDNSANGLYNQGNSLAQMQQYDEAIERYQQALKQDPDLADAKKNLETVKQAKAAQEKQQQQQQSDQQNGDKNENEQDQQKGDKQQGQDQQNKEQQSDEQQSSEQQSSQSEQQEQQQNGEQSDDANDKKSDSAQAEQDKGQQEKSAEEKAAQAVDGEEDKDGEKTPAQQASDKKAQEENQKYQQTINKVTDDPYLLLRNKMRLEYQKRRHDSKAKGVNKKW
ncbi:VWA domain-containing protein [Colwellia sp. D2M02]|uniref:VWA domain-containing protein n=1 Tax=Colwellia sp. D2M02 TaxID=2841562 RepID=UPI001C084085|nr:VWA domain-containing protein [Colwellia sp. D2M02]MBU2892068.1 VWA domain-containing protein [Colwellia sp. D2M02]